MQVITPPWISNPVDPAEETRAGMELGQRAVAQQQSNQQGQQSLALQQERQMQQEHEQAVADQLNQQYLQLATKAAADTYQRSQKIQAAIQGGMDPIKAHLMFGGSGTTLPAGAYGAYQREQAASKNAPPPSQPTRSTTPARSWAA